MKRRLALATAAAVALVSGVAVGWRRGAGTEGEASDAASAFWIRRFPLTDDTSLAMSELRGKPLLLNLWATWCPPCVREMPLIDAFAGAHPDWNVLALAIDGAEPVRRFVRDHQIVRMRVALATDDGPGLARSLGNVTGGLPYSLHFDASGGVVGKHLGALDESVLARWAMPPGAGQ